MKINQTSDYLRRLILRYSIMATVSAGIMIALIVIVPFSIRLQKEQNSNLIHQVHVKSMIVEEFLSRAADTASQITSRTQIRKKLDAYNRQEIDLATLLDFSTPKLVDAMRLSEDVVGISRLDKMYNLTVQTGQVIPEELWSIPAESSLDVLINGPINIDSDSYIVLGAPILGRNSQRIGTDIILFKADRLRQMIEDYSGLGDSGETILGKIEDNEISLFYPFRTQIEKKTNSPSQSEESSRALFTSSIDQDGLYAFNNSQGTDSIIVFEPIRGGLWGLFIRMDKYELYGSVYQLILVTGGMVACLILLGAWGMHRLLRPMVGKILIHTDDLEAKIEEQTTELKGSYERLKCIQGELSQKHKMEAIGTMAGGIAHNFNNNLAIILGNIDIAKKNKTQPAMVENCLSNARIAVMRSRDLISQILTYSRKKTPSLVPIKLHSILNETIQLLHATIPSSITVTHQVSNDSDHTILADESQIQEALFNLCNNAVQAMNDVGTLSLSLNHTELQPQDILNRYNCNPGLYLRLSVQDDGCGISSNVQENIFDPFFTTKDVNKGTGMGLSTVQGIMQKMNGMITVKSSIGRGSTFTLYFPIIKERNEPPTNWEYENLDSYQEVI
jgi:signal transduction histidine kinase